MDDNMSAKSPNGHLGGSASGGKKIFSLIILVVAGVLLWRFALPIQKFSQELPGLIRNASTTTGALTQIKNIEKNVFAPAPLKGSSTPKIPSPVLTRAGVISWTNVNRRQNGNLPALKENSLLDQAAQNKLNDMFKQQYFEHINPQDKGPSSLAIAVGYQYISIGENLALGFFDNDQDLLNAWMNSPGHRANILNSGFEEMGAAVGKGIFEGKETWLAVQEFGRPQSSCPVIDSNLKAQLTSLQAEASALQAQLAAAKAELDALNPKSREEYDAYNEKVAEYNNLIKIYNNKIDTLKLNTSQYNAEVGAYNACLGS
jgi:uncharacterized protein YkwD